MKKWCPHCEEEVGPADIVRGYEASTGRYVLVENEEIARVRPESTHTVDISHIVPAAAIDPIAIERTEVMAPADAAAGSSFAVLRDALGDKAAVGRVALHGREYLVAVVPRDRALLLHSLRTAGEIRDIDAIEDLRFATAKARPEEVKLAKQVLGSFETAGDLRTFTDNYEDALSSMLKKKSAEGEVVTTPDESKPGKVMNLMEALRQSLDSVQAKKARPVKSPGRVIEHPSSRKRRRAS